MASTAERPVGRIDVRLNKKTKLDKASEQQGALQGGSFPQHSMEQLASERQNMKHGFEVGDEVCPVDDLDQGVLVTGVIIGFKDAARAFEPINFNFQALRSNKITLLISCYVYVFRFRYEI